jgi:polyisoprenoid-binding protein YceI
MQEHFNENYVESDKYPRATFSGTFSGDIDPAGQQAVIVQVKGKISLHGVEKEFSTPATIEIKDGVMNGTAKFQLLPQDFNIAIPSLVREKIAKQIDVVITIVCKPAK